MVMVVGDEWPPGLRAPTHSGLNSHPGVMFGLVVLWRSLSKMMLVPIGSGSSIT